MKIKTGLTQLATEFVRHLGTAAVRARLAPLQLIGRLENYIVLEFAYYVFAKSKGSRFVETNSGNAGEQRVDLAYLRQNRAGLEIVEALIEAKYLRNRHRRSSRDRNANDEIYSTLKNLKSQLSYRPSEHQAKRPVCLRSRNDSIYGFVFASYTRRASEPNQSPSFFRIIRKKAQKLGLQYHDLPLPHLQKAYEDYPIKLLGTDWRVSLRLGLWRLSQSQAGA